MDLSNFIPALAAFIISLFLPRKDKKYCNVIFIGGLLLQINFLLEDPSYRSSNFDDTLIFPIIVSLTYVLPNVALYTVLRFGASFLEEETKKENSPELKQVIEKVLELLDASNSSSNDIPGIKTKLNSTLEQINEGESVNINELTILFSPTGFLQEISIENNWSGDFLELAAVFDDCCQSKPDGI